jgi:ABC-type Na+ efflux pump permease subunit
MNIVRIALNDVRIVLKDKMIIVWWLALPLAFVFIFGFIAADPSKDGTWIPVFKLDDHELADLFIEELKADKYWIDVKPTTDQQYIADWPQALIIPESFSQAVFSGERVDLTLTRGRGNAKKYIAAQTLLLRALIRFNTAIASVDLIERGWSDQTKQELISTLGATPRLTVEMGQDDTLRPPPIGFAFTLPTYMVLFVMTMTVMYGGITLVEEKINKRITRLATMPVSPLEIFLGKMLGRMLQPMLQGGVLLAVGVLIFGVGLGDHPLALIPVMISFSFFCGALGLLCGVLCRTEQQVTAAGLLATMLLGALGGCWWPLEVVPPLFKTIALATPSFWAVRGLQDVMTFGKSFGGVLPECAVLIAFGAVLTGIAIPLFRWDKS